MKDIEWLVNSARQHPLSTSIKQRFKEIVARYDVPLKEIKG